MFGLGNKKENFGKILEDVLNNNNIEQIKGKFSISLLKEILLKKQ